MELGNEIMGHSRGEFPIKDRLAYSKAMDPLFAALGCDNYGTRFDNDTFYMRMYCWCDNDDCPQCGTLQEVNFFHKPSGLRLMWYKYAMRDAYLSQDLSVEQFQAIIAECVASVLPTQKEPSEEMRKIIAISVFPTTASPYVKLFDPAAHAEVTAAAREAVAETVSGEVRLNDTDPFDPDAWMAIADKTSLTPLPERVTRRGDMGEDMRLELFRDADGDIYITVLPLKHKFSDHCVEFCVPGHGGGKSSRTFEALQNLMRAMEADERENPQT